MNTAAASLPAGPKAHPAWQLLRYSQSPLPYLEDCARRYGDTFMLRFAGYGRLAIFSAPDAVRDVFRGDNEALHSGEGNEFLSYAVGKSSVLVLDGEPHARQRRVLLPPLRGERMRSFFAAMVESTRSAVSSWRAGATLRMIEPMQDITLAVMLRVVLGLESREEIAAVALEVNRVLGSLRARHALVLVKVLPIERIQRSPLLPFQRRIRDLDSALFKVIERLRRVPEVDRGDSIVADLLAARDANGNPPSDAEIRDALITAIIAGHDTTSVALAWAFERIVSHPEVVARITDEISRVTGGGDLGEEHLAQLDYLDAAIKESLRSRTVLPFVVRLTKRPFGAGGREYPAGILLCPCMHLVHRREDLFPEPESFRPERFLERRFAAHEWFPFGGGGRTCLGMAFALFEMKVVLATVLSSVRLARPAGISSNPIRRGLALAPDDGARISVLRES